jgi:outer membrane protein W
MKKQIYCSALYFLIAISSVHSQNKVQLQADFNYASPSGMFGDMYNSGFGMGADVIYPLSDRFDVYFSTGYYTWMTNNSYFEGKVEEFFGNDIEMDNNAYFSEIPAVIGVNFYFLEGAFRPYANLALGMSYSILDKINVDINTGETFNIPEDETKVTTGYNLGIGVLYRVNQDVSFDISAKYSGNSFELKEEYKINTATTTYEESRNETISYLRLMLGIRYHL